MIGLTERVKEWQMTHSISATVGEGVAGRKLVSVNFNSVVLCSECVLLKATTTIWGNLRPNMKFLDFADILVILNEYFWPTLNKLLRVRAACCFRKKYNQSFGLNWVKKGLPRGNKIKLEPSHPPTWKQDMV